MEFLRQNIISIDQFDRGAVEKLFQLAHRLRPIGRGGIRCTILNGKILGNLFFEPSTRTRVSFASAWMRLGGTINSTVGVRFSSMHKGESLEDTIRIISGNVDLVTMRHPEKGSVERAAKKSVVPIINGGDGPGEHPTQALLDAFTILEEYGHIDNITVAMFGDLKYGRTVHSLVKILLLYNNVRFIFAAPESIQIPDDIIAEIESKGCKWEKTDNLLAAIEEADVVYGTRIQEERFDKKEEFEALSGKFILNRSLVEAHCRKDVVLMHPLPRLDEFSTDLDDLPNAAYFRQADNGLLIRMALFALVLGKESKFI